MKRYYERDEESEPVLAGCFEQVMVGQGVEGQGAIDWLGDGSDPKVDEMCEQYIIPMPSPTQKEFVQHIKVNEDIGRAKQDEIWNLLYRLHVFTDVPKRTTLMKCKIELTTNEAIASRHYPVLQAMRETISKEIEDMLKLGVIERSDSPYGHPIVIVKKADSSNRFCIDFRHLNKVTVFDPEPIPDPTDLFAKLAWSIWYTKMI